MIYWQIGLLIFGVSVTLFRSIYLAKNWQKLAPLKRRQDVVFLVFYTLLLALIVIPRRFAGWKMFADILMLVALFYWFRLLKDTPRQQKS